MEKKTSWNISHGKVRIHSKTFIPDSWDLSSSITRVEYLVFFPSLLKFAGKIENYFEGNCSLVRLNTDPSLL